MIPGHVPLVETTRGGTTECVHYGSVAVVDAQGRLVASAGDPESLNFTRSTLKPLQALPFLEDGGLSRYNLDSQALALMCASHSGEAMHIEVVGRILKQIEAGEADLQCGCQTPYYYAATETVPPSGARFNQLSHNCSGKHSGFLAFCRLHDHPTANYLDAGHPLQLRIRLTVTRFAQGDATAQGIDGCSAPNFAMPLKRIAQTYARIATDDAAEMRAIYFAMTRHPDLVSGTSRSDLALMQTGGGDWVSKIGADGLQAVGIRSRGLGIAIRIADGNARALHAATVEVLQQLGLLDDPSGTPLAPFDCPPIKNFRGIEVGGVVPVLSLARH